MFLWVGGRGGVRCIIQYGLGALVMLENDGVGGGGGGSYERGDSINKSDRLYGWLET